MRSHTGPPQSCADPDEATLRVPAPRPGSVPRTGLVNRLRASRAKVVSLLAPAGYGKTTLLAQWAERDERSFAWVSVEEGDDDTDRLGRRIAAAFERVGLREGPARSKRPQASALLALDRPAVLVLDGVDHLRSKASAEVVAELAAQVRDGSSLVLAGRELPLGPLARLRAHGGLFELGARELALGRRETHRLLRGLDLELDAAGVDELVHTTEGWPAGVYLAGLALKDGGPAGEDTVVLGGDDRFVSDYLDFEHLSRLEAEEIAFLTRTSVLDTLCGPLCDAVLQTEGSARRLDALAQANVFLVPLDRRRRSYRYHRGFRAFLRAELERREPGLDAGLCDRAAAWCEENGDPETAIAYAQAAGNLDRLARLVGEHTLAAWAAGQRETVETWLGWFDETSRLERYPAIAVLEAWAGALNGQAAVAERWLAVAERSTLREPLADGSPSIEPWLAAARALLCRDGVEQMRADAESALRELGPASGWRPSALLLLGAAHLLLGEDERADRALADSAEEAEGLGVTPSRIVALSERSLLAAARGDEPHSSDLALEARRLVEEHGLERYVRSALAFAVSARRAAQLGDLDQARRELEHARALAPKLTRAVPWYSVQVSLELVRVQLALLDVSGARAWLAAADAVLARRPDLGALVARRRELGRDVAAAAKKLEGRPSTLTPAELRLVPLLATHLSFREIGEHLFVSRNTVKTQAISVYRKLGVSCRSDAIERAEELGLFEARAVSHVDFIRSG